MCLASKCERSQQWCSWEFLREWTKTETQNASGHTVLFSLYCIDSDVVCTCPHILLCWIPIISLIVASLEALSSESFIGGKKRMCAETHRGNLWRSPCRGQPACRGRCSGWGRRETWSPGRTCHPCKTQRQPRPCQSRSCRCSRPCRWLPSAAPELGQKQHSTVKNVTKENRNTHFSQMSHHWRLCSGGAFAISSIWHWIQRLAVGAFVYQLRP